MITSFVRPVYHSVKGSETLHRLQSGTGTSV